MRWGIGLLLLYIKACCLINARLIPEQIPTCSQRDLTKEQSSLNMNEIIQSGFPPYAFEMNVFRSEDRLITAMRFPMLLGAVMLNQGPGVYYGGCSALMLSILHKCQIIQNKLPYILFLLLMLSILHKCQIMQNKMPYILFLCNWLRNLCYKKKRASPSHNIKMVYGILKCNACRELNEVHWQLMTRMPCRLICLAS